MLLNEIKQNINSRSLHISDDKKSLDNFWKWFGNSKVVDDYNRPLIMYHGTNKEFTKFEKEKIGKKLLSGKGFYFDSNKSIAKKFGKNIISCYLKIENPFIIDERENSLNNQQKIYKNTEELIKQGYDGIIIIDDKGRECVIFEPNQIKSINNNGNWSLESNDINEGLKMNKLKKLLESSLGKDMEIIKEEVYIPNKPKTINVEKKSSKKGLKENESFLNEQIAYCGSKEDYDDPDLNVIGNRDGRCYIIFDPKDIKVIDKLIKENNETESFNVEKNPKEDVVETYLKSSSLRFAFNPMNNDFIICDDLHNPIPLNESVDKYITGILSPNLVEITSYISDDYNDSKEIVENLLGKRFKKIFKNHYEIIL